MEAFRGNKKISKQLRRRKQRIHYRLRDIHWNEQDEPLYLVNRSGNCTSSDQAATYLDRAIDLCLTAGFPTILLRGDTDFSQDWA
jgi:hypothetical protein